MHVAPVLSPYVSSLVVYDVDLGGPGIHRGLPGTALTLVLPVGEPLTVGWAGEAGSVTTAWSSVSGLHAAPAEIHHDGVQRGVQLGLTVRGARALLGVPAAAVSGELLTVDDVVPALRDLPERLQSTPLPSAGRVVEAALVAAVARHGEPRLRAEVGRALAGLIRGEAVEEVAAEVGFSRRRLRDLVTAECGLAPKVYQRVARFERSRRWLGRRPLAEVAARCGYADQAHLTREWTSLAGCTPTTWLREEFPFLQDRTEPDEPR
ncbi:helix-turn-helix domain-containing protein [Nocardioides caldifontis]|uniref:helix-turn-helix domain-containing protein n=1 Tax=Nocardioides caldifontis TaxID=2588938 RepID=UPI0011E06F17|nr:helix-turn-helix domain-containing protein [Nocardioides caldifontis]